MGSLCVTEPSVAWVQRCRDLSAAGTRRCGPGRSHEPGSGARITLAVIPPVASRCVTATRCSELGGGCGFVMVLRLFDSSDVTRLGRCALLLRSEERRVGKEGRDEVLR